MPALGAPAGRGPARAHSPCLLLRQRAQGLASRRSPTGDGKSGATASTLLAITQRGPHRARSGLDSQTGRVLSIAFKGAGPDGAPGEVVQTFDDFRPVGGLTLPHKQTTTLNGKNNANGRLAKISINVSVDEAAWKRTGAATEAPGQIDPDMQSPGRTSRGRSQTSRRDRRRREPLDFGFPATSGGIGRTTLPENQGLAPRARLRVDVRSE